MNQQDTRACIEKIDGLLRGFEETDPKVKGDAAELVTALMGIHGSALARMLTLIRTQGAGSEEILASLAADEDVSALLNLYGLHPIELRERVETAIAKLAPLLDSHQAKIEMLSVDAGAVSLRLTANGSGCHSSIGELRQVVEDAIIGVAPDVLDLQIQEVTPQPAPVLVTLQGLGKRGAANA
jgi:Fe-S cluster biogenesis protein NfuA